LLYYLRHNTTDAAIVWKWSFQVKGEMEYGVTHISPLGRNIRSLEHGVPIEFSWPFIRNLDEWILQQQSI